MKWNFSKKSDRPLRAGKSTASAISKKEVVGGENDSQDGPAIVSFIFFFELIYLIFATVNLNFLSVLLESFFNKRFLVLSISTAVKCEVEIFIEKFSIESLVATASTIINMPVTL